MRLSRPPSIEAAVRSAFSWALVRIFGGPDRAPIPDWRARPYRILFIRDDGIGDLMVSMEVLRAISEVSPSFTLDLLCSPQNAPFGRSLPFVNEVIVHQRGFLLKAVPTWRRLRSRKYDVAIDGRVAIGNVNKQTTCLLLSSGARWRIGIAGRRKDRVIKHMTTNMPFPFEVATGDVRLCGALAEIDEETGRAISIERIDVPGGNADQAYDADDKNPTPPYASGGD